MVKRIGVLVFTGLLITNLYGCVLLAGAAGGAGTAVWIGDKLSEQVNVSYDRAINAARSALRSLKLEITKESKGTDVAQFLAKYTDGKQIWIDIRPITENSSKVDVRVGRLSPDKAAADKIMRQIKRYL